MFREIIGFVRGMYDLHTKAPEAPSPFADIDDRFTGVMDELDEIEAYWWNERRNKVLAANASSSRFTKRKASVVSWECSPTRQQVLENRIAVLNRINTKSAECLTRVLEGGTDDLAIHRMLRDMRAQGVHQVGRTATSCQTRPAPGQAARPPAQPAQEVLQLN